MGPYGERGLLDGAARRPFGAGRMTMRPYGGKPGQIRGGKFVW